jgi:hypothetical protein
VARMPRRVTEVYTSNGRPCTYTERYHFANGQIQFDRPDVNCTWRNLDMEQPPSGTGPPPTVRPQAAGAAQPAHCVLDQRARAEGGRRSVGRRSVVGADQCLIQVDRFQVRHR